MESRSCFLTVDLESSDLGLGCQGHDCLDDLGNSEERAVVMGAMCVTGHVFLEGFACWVAMEPRAVSIVLSTHCAL